MHNLILMEIRHSLTNISKVRLYLSFIELLIPSFFEESTSIGILKNHIGDLTLSVNIMTKKLNDVLMV